MGTVGMVVEAQAEEGTAEGGQVVAAVVGPVAVRVAAPASRQAPEAETMAAEDLEEAEMAGAAAEAGRLVVVEVAAAPKVEAPMEAAGVGAAAAGEEGYEAHTRAPAGAWRVEARQVAA